MKNRFKKTVEMEKMHYLGEMILMMMQSKEKIDAIKLKINRMGTSIMMIQYLTKCCLKMVLFKMSCVSIYNTIINKATYLNPVTYEY